MFRALAATVMAANVLSAGMAGVPARAQTPSAPATDSALPALGYVLDADDQVRIMVYGEPDLTGQFTISSAGQLSFPLIGDVAAAGLTVNSLADEIAQRLKAGYVNDPRVSVEIVVARPFYILGEVEKPGQYPFASGLTVRKAVATAGGYTYRANTRVVFLKHPRSQGEQKLSLDADLPVQPGDTIRIGERYF